MKKAIIFFLLSFFASEYAILANDNSANPIEDAHSKNEGIGWYASFNNNYSSINDKVSFTVGLRGGIKLSEYLAVGISADALWYDHRLSELDPDRTYHLEGGYTGFYIEPMLPITDKFKISMQIMFGSGFTQFKYDSKYDKELTWTEEVIDRDNFGVFEPTLHAEYMISDNWALGANVVFRSTSPINMLGAKDDLMNNIGFGLSVKFVNF